MATWDYVMKFVVVGDSSTGKSSLLVQLTDKRFLGRSDPTIGVEFGSSMIDLPNGKTIKAQVWDTAGQESFRSITRSYYRGAVGALLVFDTTYRRSFLNLSRWLGDLRAYGDPDLMIVVVGNKSDLIEAGHESHPDLLSDSRQVSRAEASAWAHERGLDYIETSAKTGLNVEQAFAQVAKKIYESGRLERQDRDGNSTSFALDRANLRDTKNRLSCCGS